MSICASSKKIWGHYDEQGHWVREKYCFVSCGSRCDCMHPSLVIKPKNESEADTYPFNLHLTRKVK